MDAGGAKRIAGGAAVALASATVSLTLIAGGHAIAGSGTGEPLMPDLVVEDPHEIVLVKEGERSTAGRRKRTLQFSHTTANLGEGPLEIYPDLEQTGCAGEGSDSHTAYQALYLDGNSNGEFDPADDTLTDTREVGCMQFHDAHNHYHFEEFALYDLYRERTGVLSATSDKISFCVYDYQNAAGAAENPLPGQPETPAYDFRNCDRSDGTHGISVGWQDTYRSNTPGQSLSVTGLRRGRYCLVASADPGDRLAESASGEANNSTEARIRIKKKRATLSGAPVKRLSGPCRYPTR